MYRRAVILAGGKGTRLRPYTVVLPKPLMPIGDHPILEVIVRQLAQSGFDHITLAVNHQAEIIRAFFQDGARWNIHIDYSLEERSLGTMGPLRLIKNLPEHFLVMNGDILTDLDYKQFHDNHIAENRIFTVSSMRREHRIDYGVLESDDSGLLSSFREKPCVSHEVSMGVYMVSRRAIKYIPADINYGFDNLMINLIDAGLPAYVRPFSGYWLDIGRPDDYMLAIDEFASMKTRFLLD